MTTTFHGRTRAETKRKALTYWADNKDTLGLTLREFFDRCALSTDGTTLTFLHPAPTAPGFRRLFART